MAGFCTSCGKPLPENGVCSCNAQMNAPQQPYPQQPYPQYQPQQPYPQQPYPQQPYAPYPQQPYAPYPAYPVRQGPSAFSKFFKTIADYFKDPVGTSRSVLEKRDILSGSLTAALCVILALLGSMLYIVVQDFDFGSRVPAWIVMSIFAPAIAIGITFGVLFLLSKIAKNPTDPVGLLSATCINALLPACLLAASMLLGMIGTIVFEIFAILMFAAWAVTTFTMIFQVLNIKMNIISIGLLVVALAVAYIIVIMLLNWFLFDGSPLLYITDSTIPVYDIYDYLSSYR
ncbi:MAG: hypothetical protein E7434_06740 [Ruminococcaceae bacterium]|nr:hypothetical protein [Oscillospiraceae bacterium]